MSPNAVETGSITELETSGNNMTYEVYMKVLSSRFEHAYTGKLAQNTYQLGTENLKVAETLDFIISKSKRADVVVYKMFEAFFCPKSCLDVVFAGPFVVLQLNFLLGKGPRCILSEVAGCWARSGLDQQLD